MTALRKSDVRPLTKKVRRGRPKHSWPDVDFTELAKRIGISRSHLHNIVDGVYRPSLKVALRLAEEWTVIAGKKVTVENLAEVLRRGQQAE